MTVSLFDLLLDSMPLAGVRLALQANMGKDAKFDDFSSADMRKLLRYLPPDQDYSAGVPQVKTPNRPKEQQLWGWTHRAAEPAKIADMYCRVRDAEYATYKVLDSVEWGIEAPIGTFKNAVRITNSSGVVIDLPLTKDFVHWKWLAVAGYLPDDATPLWRLEALHDRSIVIAFVYDLDPTTSEPKSLREAAKSDPEWAAELDRLDGVARELTPEAAQAPAEEGNSGGHPATDPPVDGGTRARIEDLPWVERMRKHEFMNSPGAEGVVQGEVGGQCVAKTGAPRVVVALCLTVCRERSDYEPGGVVGVARMYPHIMVWANIPLAKVEGSIRLNRPERTTKPREGLPAKGHDCCKGNDQMNPEISAVLVCDANKDESKIPGPILPFWPNMFAYYRTEAPSYFKQERISMVRGDRPGPRDNDDGWIIRDIVGGPTSRTVSKVARQGAFDNIHMAPKMKLVNVSKVAFLGPGTTEGTFPVQRYAMGLDDITMAPFCAHDCFHMHTRWGTHATAKWTLGWDATGPYKVPGAPMVPLNQDVDIWFRSKSTLTYHVTVKPKAGNPFIMPGSCQVLMYHGAGYAAAITGVAAIWAAKMGLDALSPPPWFLGDPGGLVQSTDSWSMQYWWQRLKGRFVPAEKGGEASYVIEERTTMTDDGLRKAMAL